MLIRILDKHPNEAESCLTPEEKKQFIMGKLEIICLHGKTCLIRTRKLDLSVNYSNNQISFKKIGPKKIDQDFPR
jgi:hypothetical protein